jgi:hypothetical protein
VAGFVIDGWWGLAMTATVVVASVLITRSFGIGSQRGETRAILPQVGLRLWNRPDVPTASSPAGSVSSPTEGDDA